MCECMRDYSPPALGRLQSKSSQIGQKMCNTDEVGRASQKPEIMKLANCSTHLPL